MTDHSTQGPSFRWDDGPKGTPNTPHTDMPTRGWVTHLPPKLRAFAELARLDRPAGMYMLLWPCWWGLALGGLATGHGTPWWLYALFTIGTVLMRGAGCTINDLFDREFDARVERTRGRPLPSGRVTPFEALCFLGVELLLALFVLLCLDRTAIWLGLGSLLLVGLYPLAKRVTWWPQFVLGLAFNWGVPMGFAASTGTLAWPVLLVYMAGIAWTLAYDTIYAHQDKVDDAVIGVRSTALRLGAGSRAWVGAFFTATLVLLVLGAAPYRPGPAFLVGLAAAAANAVWQVRGWDPDSPADCLRRFRANRWFGAIVALGLLLA